MFPVSLAKLDWLEQSTAILAFIIGFPCNQDGGHYDSINAGSQSGLTMPVEGYRLLRHACYCRSIACDFMGREFQGVFLQSPFPTLLSSVLQQNLTEWLKTFHHPSHRVREHRHWIWPFQSYRAALLRRIATVWESFTTVVDV